MNETIAALIWALGLTAWFVVRYPYHRRKRRLKVVRNHWDLEERSMLFFTVVTLVLLPILHWTSPLFQAADYPFHPAAGWLGTLALLGFVWLFRRSHKDLGKNWSYTLEIREEHSLVTAGIYQFIRHPMYAAFWLWALAQALLIPNLIVGPASLVSVALLYFRRSPREERMMLDTFGDQYRAYAARTARLIPGVF